MGDIWVGTSNGIYTFKYNETKEEEQPSFEMNHIPVFQYPDSLMEKIEMAVASQQLPLSSLLQVGNSQNLSAPFELQESTEVLIIASGESVNKFDFYDYGWLENHKGIKIWEIGGGHVHAGSHHSNRIKVDIIQLPPGRYHLHYKSDESHSYSNYLKNIPPPDRPELWGIQILSISKSLTNSIKRNLENLPLNLPPLGGEFYIFKDQNETLWLANTMSEFIKIKIEKGKEPQFELISFSKDSSFVIYNICNAKDKNQLWFSGYKRNLSTGARIPVITLFDTKEQSIIRPLIEYDNLRRNIQNNAFCMDRTDRLWVGSIGNGGLYFGDTHDPTLSLTNFKIPDKRRRVENQQVLSLHL